MDAEDAFLKALERIAADASLTLGTKVDEFVDASKDFEEGETDFGGYPQSGRPPRAHEGQYDRIVFDVVQAHLSLAGDEGERADKLSNMLVAYHEHGDTETLDAEYETLLAAGPKAG